MDFIANSFYTLFHHEVVVTPWHMSASYLPKDKCPENAFGRARRNDFRPIKLSVIHGRIILGHLAASLVPLSVERRSSHSDLYMIVRNIEITFTIVQYLCSSLRLYRTLGFHKVHPTTRAFSLPLFGLRLFPRLGHVTSLHRYGYK